MLPQRWIAATINGETVQVPEGATPLDICRQIGIESPTLCYLEALTPVNACRLCVAELQGSRTVVPACSRKAKAGAVVHTESGQVRHSRKLLLELLSSSVDTSLAGADFHRWMKHYQATPDRFGPPPPIVKVTSSLDHSMTRGHLCIKGRFGWQFVQDP
jgi:predicted molibdopterin-dependent oxidoreductase YjgC